jgi:3-hydroxyacyl-CoA dehydrogenase
MDVSPVADEASAPRVAIVGAGRIGRSLGRLLQTHGGPVALIDVDDAMSPVGDADLIVEALPEDLATKRRVLATVRGYAPTTPVLSTTSSLLPDDLRAGDALLGLWHPFAPLSRLRIVEVATSPGADPAVLQAAHRLADATDRQLLRVGATPGLVGNRLLKHATHAGLQAWDDGLALDVVDDAFVAAGLPLGPNAVVHLVGVPTSLAVSQRFAAALGPRYEPPAALPRLADDPQVRGAWERAVTASLERPRADIDDTAAPIDAAGLQRVVAHALERIRAEIDMLVQDRIADRSTIATIAREGLGWSTLLLERLEATPPSAARSAHPHSP